MLKSPSLLYWVSQAETEKVEMLNNVCSPVQIAGSEEEVAEQLKLAHFDILLFSKDLSVFDLAEAVKKIKRKYRNLVMISHRQDYTNREEVLKAGCTDCITDELWHSAFLFHVFTNAIKCADLDRQRRESVVQFKKLESRLNTIMGNTPVILFILDAAGTFTIGLGKLFDKFKVNKSFVIGQRLEEVYHEYPAFVDAFRHAQKGEIQKISINIRNIIFEIVLTPVFEKDGAVKEILGLAHDVTERAKSEMSLLKAKGMAENAAKIKQEFIANMSHEIRTPLNAIVGFINLLDDSVLNFVQKDYVSSIKIASENLLALINSILDFSKIENGTFKQQSEEFNLKHVINSIDKVLSLKVLEKKIGFEIMVDDNVPVELLGDPNRLYQILSNLLANSLKFTEKGKVSLSVNVSSKVGHTVYVNFSVKDTGIGIPTHMREKIFESFTQVNPESNRKYGGTGLGLSIVKKIVDQMQGTISLESQMFKGSTFNVVLPFAMAEEMEVKRKKLARPPRNLNLPKGLRILLAEDNLMNQKLVLQLLSNYPVKVDLAETGVEVIKAHKSNHYDVILMDIQMPDMDGLEATKIIRKDFEEHLKNVPIIAMTAHAFQEELDKCLMVGMNDYVIKPIDVELFINKINENIAVRTSEDLINLSYLREMFGEDQLVIQDILQTFTAEAPEMINAMREAILTKKADDLARGAHKAKASFKMAGMQRAYNKILEIEKLGRDGKTLGAEPLVEDVAEELAEAINFMQAEGFNV